MSRIKDRDTKPEIYVRSLIRKLGYHTRYYKSGLPGNPDVVIRRLKKVIFVHGCFWHGHKKCGKGKVAARPSTRKKFWSNKLESNISRDKRNIRELRKLDWRPMVVWECELKKPERILIRIRDFLSE